jgi:hypothetical protein
MKKKIQKCLIKAKKPLLKNHYVTRKGTGVILLEAEKPQEGQW